MFAYVMPVPPKATCKRENKTKEGLDEAMSAEGRYGVAEVAEAAEKGEVRDHRDANDGAARRRFLVKDRRDHPEKAKLRREERHMMARKRMPGGGIKRTL
jgi:hypothetical protein